MKIFDLFILGKFFVTFFQCYLGLVGLLISISLPSNFSDFLAVGDMSKLITIIPAFYFIDSIRYIDMFFPFLLLLSATITTLTMDHYNEVIALQALGTSPGRILTPMLIGAVAASLLFTAVREFYLPKHLVRISMKPADFAQESDVFPVCRSTDSKTQISIDGKEALLATNEIRKPSILLRKNLNTYGNRLTALEGVYQNSDKNHPAGWRLKGVTGPSELLKNKSLQDESLGETIIFSPSDTTWLKDDEVFVATSLKPIHLVTGENWFLYGPVWELNDALKDPTFKEEAISLAIRVHRRFLRPLTDLLPLFLGIPFILLRRDKKSILAIAKGAGLASAYVVSQYISAYVGNALNMVAFGIWAPIFIFVPIASVLYSELVGKSMRQKS